MENQSLTAKIPTDPLVTAAAQWLTDQRGAVELSATMLCEKFNLTVQDAHYAADLARRFRICRRAFG